MSGADIDETEWKWRCRDCRGKLQWMYSECTACKTTEIAKADRMLIALGRSIAPQINEALSKLKLPK